MYLFMQPFGFPDSIVFKVVLIVFLLEAGWPLLLTLLRFQDPLEVCLLCYQLP